MENNRNMSKDGRPPAALSFEGLGPAESRRTETQVDKASTHKKSAAAFLNQTIVTNQGSSVSKEKKEKNYVLSSKNQLHLATESANPSATGYASQVDGASRISQHAVPLAHGTGGTGQTAGGAPDMGRGLVSVSQERGSAGQRATTLGGNTLSSVVAGAGPGGTHSGGASLMAQTIQTHRQKSGTRLVVGKHLSRGGAGTASSNTNQLSSKHIANIQTLQQTEKIIHGNKAHGSLQRATDAAADQLRTTDPGNHQQMLHLMLEESSTTEDDEAMYGSAGGFTDEGVLDASMGDVPLDAADSKHMQMIQEHERRVEEEASSRKEGQPFTQNQEEVRMQIRMHIIEESKAEWREMPQEFDGCDKCWLQPQLRRDVHKSQQPLTQRERLRGGNAKDLTGGLKHVCCRQCGTLFDKEYSCGAIKEPRFHKNTYHMEPIALYRQMCYDEIERTRRVENERSRTMAAGGASEVLSRDQLDFLQEIREQAIIKILESGVHLCLKLQTSHIASIYFEKWMKVKSAEGLAKCWCFGHARDVKGESPDPEGTHTWLEHMAELSDRQMRSHVELITLSCLLLASKLNEQNQSQPTIRDLRRLVNDKFEFDDFVEQERWLLCHGLGWAGVNVTTPYHVTDAIQGMGCLFWGDLNPKVYQSLADWQSLRGPRRAAENLSMESRSSDDGFRQADNIQRIKDNLVILLIQYRKYINYFVEQSLINGLWSKYPHSALAVASILISRFELQKIHEVRYRRKPVNDTEPWNFRILKTFHQNLKLFDFERRRKLPRPGRAHVLELTKTSIDVDKAVNVGASQTLRGQADRLNKLKKLSDVANRPRRRAPQESKSIFQFWKLVELCIDELYQKIFDGAVFPFYREIGRYLDGKEGRQVSPPTKTEEPTGSGVGFSIRVSVGGNGDRRQKLNKNGQPTGQGSFLNFQDQSLASRAGESARGLDAADQRRDSQSVDRAQSDQSVEIGNVGISMNASAAPAPLDGGTTDSSRFPAGPVPVKHSDSSRKQSSMRPSKITNINVNSEASINHLGAHSGMNTGSNSKITGPAKSPYMPSRDAARLLKKRQGSQQSQKMFGTRTAGNRGGAVNAAGPRTSVGASLDQPRVALQGKLASSTQFGQKMGRDGQNNSKLSNNQGFRANRFERVEGGTLHSYDSGDNDGVLLGAPEAEHQLDQHRKSQEVINTRRFESNTKHAVMELGSDAGGSLPRPNIVGMTQYTSTGPTSIIADGKGASVLDGEFTMRSSDGAIGVSGIRTTKQTNPMQQIKAGATSNQKRRLPANLSQDRFQLITDSSTKNMPPNQLANYFTSTLAAKSSNQNVRSSVGVTMQEPRSQQKFSNLKRQKQTLKPPMGQIQQFLNNNLSGSQPPAMDGNNGSHFSSLSQAQLQAHLSGIGGDKSNGLNMDPSTGSIQAASRDFVSKRSVDSHAEPIDGSRSLRAANNLNSSSHQMLAKATGNQNQMSVQHLVNQQNMQQNLMAVSVSSGATERYKQKKQQVINLYSQSGSNAGLTSSSTQITKAKTRPLAHAHSYKSSTIRSNQRMVQQHHQNNVAPIGVTSGTGYTSRGTTEPGMPLENVLSLPNLHNPHQGSGGDNSSRIGQGLQGSQRLLNSMEFKRQGAGRSLGGRNIMMSSNAPQQYNSQAQIPSNTNSHQALPTNSSTSNLMAASATPGGVPSAPGTAQHIKQRSVTNATKSMTNVLQLSQQQSATHNPAQISQILAQVPKNIPNGQQDNMNNFIKRQQVVASNSQAGGLSQKRRTRAAQATSSGASARMVEGILGATGNSVALQQNSVAPTQVQQAARRNLGERTERRMNSQELDMPMAGQSQIVGIRNNAQNTAMNMSMQRSLQHQPQARMMKNDQLSKSGEYSLKQLANQQQQHYGTVESGKRAGDFQANLVPSLAGKNQVSMSKNHDSFTINSTQKDVDGRYASSGTGKARTNRGGPTMKSKLMVKDMLLMSPQEQLRVATQQQKDKGGR